MYIHCTIYGAPQCALLHHHILQSLQTICLSVCVCVCVCVCLCAYDYVLKPT